MKERSQKDFEEIMNVYSEEEELKLQREVEREREEVVHVRYTP